LEEKLKEEEFDEDNYREELKKQLIKE